jgi:hypothetical protein
MCLGDLLCSSLVSAEKVEKAVESLRSVTLMSPHGGEIVEPGVLDTTHTDLARFGNRLIDENS